MSELVSGAIDVDVHIVPDSITTLFDYLDPYWHWYIRHNNLRLLPQYPERWELSARAEAREAGPFPPRAVDALRSQLLDRTNPEFAVLNCVTQIYEYRNVYYQGAITRAINDWVRAEWLDQDDRLRASIVVPSTDDAAAAEEIDRLGDDPRFVQVLLPVRSETPWGNVRWGRIHEAAARNNLPIALHPGGPFGLSVTGSGYSPSYFEDYLYNGHLIALAQMMSLVLEGVFDKYPNLNILLSELGSGWIPSLSWRVDKDWNAAWRETPWLTSAPSYYIGKHFRATTAPMQLPPSVSNEEIARFAKVLSAQEILMYASDYPHDHGDDGVGRLLEVLGDSGAEAVLRGNARAFYGPRIGASLTAVGTT